MFHYAFYSEMLFCDMQVTSKKDRFFGSFYDFAWLCRILYQILHELQAIITQANLLAIT